MVIKTTMDAQAYYVNAEKELQEAILRGMRTALQAGVREIKADAPVKTGRLRKGIRSWVYRRPLAFEAAIESEAPYAPYVQARTGFATAGMNHARDRVQPECLAELKKAGLRL